MNWAFSSPFSRPLPRMRWWVGSCRIVEWMHLLSISKLEECPLYSRFPFTPYKWGSQTHGFANLVAGTPAGRISWTKKTPHLSSANIMSNQRKCSLYTTKNKIWKFKYTFFAREKIWPLEIDNFWREVRFIEEVSLHLWRILLWLQFLVRQSNPDDLKDQSIFNATNWLLGFYLLPIVRLALP